MRRKIAHKGSRGPPRGRRACRDPRRRYPRSITRPSVNVGGGRVSPSIGLRARGEVGAELLTSPHHPRRQLGPKKCFARTFHDTQLRRKPLCDIVFSRARSAREWLENLSGARRFSSGGYPSERESLTIFITQHVNKRFMSRCPIILAPCARASIRLFAPALGRRARSPDDHTRHLRCSARNRTRGKIHH